MYFEIKRVDSISIKLILRKKTFTEIEEIHIIEYIKSIKGIKGVKLYNKIGELKIKFSSEESLNICLKRLEELSYKMLMEFKPNSENVNKIIELNNVKKKIIKLILFRYIGKYIFPAPLSFIRTIYKSCYFIKLGFESLKRKKLDVAVLDATAIGVSLVRNDFSTANSIIFLLSIGELLEDYTHKKVVAELSRSLAINIEKVWKLEGEVEEEVSFNEVNKGDRIVVRSGCMIPFDGTVVSGVATVNQASLTGESIGVPKTIDNIVYAGTVVEDGEIVLEVISGIGTSRIDEVIQLIENADKNKSKTQQIAYNISEKLVKYSFLGFGLTYIITKNINRALSFLMVDYSCAIKLCTPIAIMSAMKECTDRGILIKGGKYLENIAEADTIVFDKTGTLTEAMPTVVDVIGFNGYNREEVLRLAACLEEHFPHSLANAVVKKAKEENINHDEMHGKVKYIVAHGIASEISGDKVIIGSKHFIFEDEGVECDEVIANEMDKLSSCSSYLYLAMNQKLIGILVIDDPIKQEAAKVILKLRKQGFKNIVMLTGDNYNTAKAIADKLGIDDFVSNVLPADKSSYISKMKQEGHTVIMVGDGVNDSPALSFADVGIAMAGGSDIAKEVSDVVIKEDRLEDIIYLRNVSVELKKRISSSYKEIVGFNTTLILLGLFNIIQPGSSALLHNVGTVVTAAKCMKKLSDDDIN